ncbi:MAG: 1-acyl-sn-glycerol-3-phosphate acyltransferase [Bacteroidota bacterium]|nr:1-acyl-sn-glycerol-3-phosphate acyltransferase [Bacteroidota bacterium]
MLKFDSIRPFYDEEVSQALQKLASHPMMKAIMEFTFPNLSAQEIDHKIRSIQSIQEFQANIAYHAIRRILEKSSEGLTVSGFEKLEKDTSYLFISNHRDIILDTSILNITLLDYGLVLTSSAVGDNLVKKQAIYILSKLNRNFLIQRNSSPRELLLSSKLVSEYINKLITEDNRSVWIAQREGRTKDGNDITQQGVLKMFAMGNDSDNLMAYFKKLRIVPMSISYEYDPTDMLKMPRLIAEANQEDYVKEKNEDFITLMSGIIGQKKRIHLHIGDVLDTELDFIDTQFEGTNKQIQALAKTIDHAIISGYKLWPTNYIAYDLLHKGSKYSDKYTSKEKGLFERRLEMRIKEGGDFVRERFLYMYANPVINKEKYEEFE